MEVNNQINPLLRVQLLPIPSKPALWSSVPENLISTHFSVLEVGSQDFGTLLSGVDFYGQSTCLRTSQSQRSGSHHVQRQTCLPGIAWL